MINHYRRLLDEGSISEDSNTPFIDFCCIEFPFYAVCFMLRSHSWTINVDLESRIHRTHRYPAAPVLIGWNNVEVLLACSSNRLLLYVGYVASIGPRPRLIAAFASLRPRFSPVTVTR